MKRGKLQVMLPSVPGACNLLFLAAVNLTFFFSTECLSSPNTPFLRSTSLRASSSSQTSNSSKREQNAAITYQNDLSK